MREERRITLRGFDYRQVIWGAADSAPCEADVASYCPSSAPRNAAQNADGSSGVAPIDKPSTAFAPVVLLHGFAQCADSWDAAAALLSAEGHVVYAFDLVGHGRSERPDDIEAYGLRAQATALLDYLDVVTAQEGARPQVVGYSMGGRIALVAACCDPQAFVRSACAFVLESTGLGPRTHEERQAAAWRDEMCATRLRTDGLQAFMDYWERLPLFATQRDLPENVRARVRAGRLTNDSEALARTFMQAGQHAMPDRADVLATLAILAEKGVVLSYLVGERDEKYRALAENPAVARVMKASVVLGVGHNVHLENPVAFVQAINPT